MELKTSIASIAAVVFAAAALAGCGSDTPDPTNPPVAATVTVATTAQPPPLTQTPSAIESSSSTSTSAPVTPVDPAVFDDNGGGVAWKSPTGQISCRLATKTFESGCQSRTAPVPDGANCVNPTFTVDQLSKGFVMQNDTVTPLCFNQGVFSIEFPQVLPYEHSITFDDITCTSRESGMSCTNGLGHGFVLSMQEARQF